MATPSSKERIFRGTPICTGIARGVIQMHGVKEETVPRRAITDSEIPLEIARFEEALIVTRQQLLGILQRVSQAVGAEDANIFEAHLLVLEDRTLIEEVVKRLHADKENVESIFDKVARKYVQALAQIDDPYLRERSADISDVTRRVLGNLMGHAHDDLHHVAGDRILVANQLSPSEVALLNFKPNLGVALEMGSPGSHTAILLRTKGIPAVIGLHDALSQVAAGQVAVLDGYNGLLILDPSDETLWQYGELEVKRHTIETQLEALRDLPTQTLDGRLLTLSANFESMDELPAIRSNGAQGIGLFRTEYYFLNRQDLPTEDEQYNAYARVAKEMKSDPIVIRTVDLGRDKLPMKTESYVETNPFLGWCSIRYCFEHVEMFKTQLRAILRASAHGNVKLMFPMISSVSEVKQARAILEEAKDELQKRSLPFNPEMEVGVMIEIPSAALTADLIAREVDFFSIGTNDLTQYSIAVDRTNEKIAHLYQPTHPALVKLLKMVCDAGRARGIWVGLCGEMAADPSLTPLLVGLGLDELSSNARSVPAIKHVTRSLNFTEAQKLVDEALTRSTGDEIYALTNEFARRVAPDLFAGS